MIAETPLRPFPKYDILCDVNSGEGARGAQHAID